MSTTPVPPARPPSTRTTQPLKPINSPYKHPYNLALLRVFRWQVLTSENVMGFFSGCRFSPFAVLVDPDRPNEAYALVRSRGSTQSRVDLRASVSPNCR